jgi:hypothetical protein
MDDRFVMIIAMVGGTLLFGPIFPILFPICLLFLVIQYVKDRLMVAYEYRETPFYDRMMITLTLKLMQLSTVGYLFIGAWIYSNQQVFRNEVYVRKNYMYFESPTGHTFWQGFTQVNPGLIYGITILAYCAWTLIKLIRDKVAP